jgi:hypothetical protein
MCVVKVETGKEEDEHKEEGPMVAKAQFTEKNWCQERFFQWIRVACLIFVLRLQEAHPKKVSKQG